MFGLNHLFRRLTGQGRGTEGNLPIDGEVSLEGEVPLGGEAETKEAAKRRIKSRRKKDGKRRNKQKEGESTNPGDQGSHSSRSHYTTATEEILQIAPLHNAPTQHGSDRAGAEKDSELISALSVEPRSIESARRENDALVEEQSEPSAGAEPAPLPQAPVGKIEARYREQAAQLSDIHNAQYDTSEVRRIVWRAVVRANYFWINPDTQEPSPLRAFNKQCQGETVEQCVIWQAEQEAEVGHTVPDHTHVMDIGNELRYLFDQARAGPASLGLAHLAFLLWYWENKVEGPRTLTLAEVQRMLALAFRGVNMPWGDMLRFKPAEIDAKSAAWKDDFMAMEIALVEGTWTHSLHRQDSSAVAATA
ncbi:hypothetical protein LTR17_025450 [Elasticomyces elasticus]|nr:hypothetical protein LTR17_025450 [Elasticomyces elasticus]